MRLVCPINALRVGLEVEIAQEEIACWVRRVLLELSLIVAHKGTELRVTDLGEDEIQAHELAHLVLIASDLP